MSSPLSGYDFIYKAMTAEERNELQSRISQIMTASALTAAETIKKAMENSLNDLVVTPFISAVSESNTDYEWVTAISNALWKKLLNSSPNDIHSYQITQLIDAWKTNYPEHFYATIDGELSKQMKSLEERLQFEINLNRNQYR